MRRTGNGTARTQWLYVLWNIPFIWTVKVGISGNHKRRHREVDKSAPGWDFIVYAVRIPFAYQVEQTVHGLMAWCRVGFWGSGHTERFWVIAAVPAVVLSLAVFVLYRVLWVLALVGLVLVVYSIYSP
jgi:hypothetical protein